MKHLATFVVLGAFAVVGASAESSYAGQHIRELKALSPQEVDDYLNGRGLGFAKAAELNHYPGPRHVLDLSVELALSLEQGRQTVAIFEAMKAEAIAVGTQLVERESELDRQFASGVVSPESLAALTSEIGALHGKLRFVHLRAHLEQRSLLSEHQIRSYDQLRSYRLTHGNGHGHSH